MSTLRAFLSARLSSQSAAMQTATTARERPSSSGRLTRRLPRLGGGPAGGVRARALAGGPRGGGSAAGACPRPPRGRGGGGGGLGRRRRGGEGALVAAARQPPPRSGAPRALGQDRGP